MATITKISKKDIKKTRIALVCFMLCPAKLSCFLFGFRDKPCHCRFKIGKDDIFYFPEINYDGDCPNLAFRNECANTPLMGLIKKFFDDYRHDYDEKPPLDAFLTVIISFLYPLYYANGSHFPSIPQKFIKDIEAAASMNRRTFYQEKVRTLARLNEDWFKYVASLGENLGVVEPYMKKAILLWTIFLLSTNESGKYNNLPTPAEGIRVFEEIIAKNTPQNGT